MKKNSTKEMNKSKLANYTAMAGAVLASGAVNAQITYVDVNPDAVIDASNSPFNVDMNNDANPDVILGVTPIAGSGSATYMGIPFTYSYTGNAAFVQAGSGGGILGSVTGSSSTFQPSLLISGDPITAAGNFGSGGALGVAGIGNIPAFSITNYPFTQGNFVGVTDAFLGVKLTNAGNTHYGWLRFDVAADASTITLKDYAFNSVAAGDINAGQTAGLEDIAVNQKVTIKTQLDQAFVNVTPDLIGGEIAMVDMAGNDVKVITIGDVDTTVSFDGIDTGIYILTARFENGQVTKKVYVK